jgi:hypothetical protein
LFATPPPPQVSGAVQSAFEQQPVLGIQALPQRLKLSLHVKSQAVPLQAVVALAGAVHATQVAPQSLKLGAHVVLHEPSPEQTKFPPHPTAGLAGQAPLRQVGAGIWLFPLQLALPQTAPLVAAKLHTPLAPQVPGQLAFVPGQS